MELGEQIDNNTKYFRSRTYREVFSTAVHNYDIGGTYEYGGYTWWQ